MPSLLTQEERDAFLRDTPIWKMNKTQYQLAKGVHQPWIAEISPFQHSNLSNRARRAYDAKRSQEWAASGACKVEYDQLVYAAYKRGEFTLKDEGVTKDAESAVGYMSAQERQQEREQRISEAKRENQILHVDDAEIGDRVYIVGFSSYATVIKKLKVSFRLKSEGSGREFKIAAAACNWLSYSDMVKAVDERRPINPRKTEEAPDPEPPQPTAPSIIPTAQTTERAEAATVARSLAPRITPEIDGQETPGVTLERAEELIRAELQQRGIFERGWTYAIEQSRSRFGIADFDKKQIRFSGPVIEVNTEAELLDTIRHEIAHVLAGIKAGHGPVWKLHALALGARPEACCGKNVISPDMKYHAVCPKCNYRFTRDRLPMTKNKRTKERRPYAGSCGYCTKRYGMTRSNLEAFALVWVETATGNRVEWPPKPAAEATASAEAVESATEAEAPEVEKPEVWTVKPLTHAVQVSLF